MHKGGRESILQNPLFNPAGFPAYYPQTKFRLLAPLHFLLTRVASRHVNQVKIKLLLYKETRLDSHQQDESRCGFRRVLERDLRSLGGTIRS